MKIKIQTTQGIKKVNAEFAFEMYGHQFVIHREIENDKRNSSVLITVRVTILFHLLKEWVCIYMNGKRGKEIIQLSS